MYVNRIQVFENKSEDCLRAQQIIRTFAVSLRKTSDNYSQSVGNERVLKQ